MTQIHWYPGHMAKTIKELTRITQGVDIIVELLDARIPLSSRNPIIDTLITKKHHHIIALTKSDLADPVQTKKWISKLSAITPYIIEINCLKGKGIKQLLEICKQISVKKREKKRFHITKVLICGIPNVGKSALINKLAKKKAATVQNRPGVTKQTKGTMIDLFIELIDSPGILWPKLDDQSIAIKLALTKAIKETIVDDPPLVNWLLSYGIPHYPNQIKQRYKITNLDLPLEELIHTIGHSMQWITTKKSINEAKVYRSIIEDFQKHRLGRISLDRPDL